MIEKLGQAGVRLMPEIQAPEMPISEEDTFEELHPAKLLLGHIQSGNKESAIEIIRMLFAENKNLKLKDLQFEIKKHGPMGVRLDHLIQKDQGSLFRSLSKKDSTQRVETLTRIVGNLIDDLKKEQTHPAALPFDLSIRQSAVTLEASPKIVELQTQLTQKEALLKENSRQLASLRTEFETSKRQLAKPESQIAELAGQLENAEQALEVFNTIKNLTPKEREEQLQGIQPDHPWYEPLKLCYPIGVTLDPNNREEIAKSLGNYLDLARQKPKKELLDRSIASAEYQLKLVNQVIELTQKRIAAETKIEALRTAKKEQALEINRLEKQTNSLAAETKNLNQQLNWEGYQVRARMIQDTNKQIEALIREQKQLRKDLDADKGLMIPSLKKTKETRLTQINTLILSKNHEFREQLIALEQFDVDAGIRWDAKYPKDKIPYPSDPGYSADEISKFLSFNPVNNPLFTGGKNYRPSLQELVRDYQLATQGVTLAEAYGELWAKLKTITTDIPTELSRFNEGQKTNLEKMLTLSNLLGSDTHTGSLVQSVKTLLVDYPLECSELAGNICHANEILGRSLQIAGGSEGMVSSMLQEYRAVGATMATQNVVADILIGERTALYSAGALRPMPPALLAAADFSKYLPYLAATLVPSTGQKLANQTGAALVAGAAIGVGAGLMSKTQAAALVGTDLAVSFVPEGIKTWVTGAKTLQGIYAQVRGEQLAMKALRYQAGVKGSKIAQLMSQTSVYEQAIRDAVLFGRSKAGVRRLGTLFRAAVEGGDWKRVLTGVTSDYTRAWKEHPVIKGLKTAAMIGAGVGVTLATGGGALAVLGGVSAAGAANALANRVHDFARTPQDQAQKASRPHQAKLDALKLAYQECAKTMQMPALKESELERLASSENPDQEWDKMLDEKNLERQRGLAAQAGIPLEDYQAAEQQLIKQQGERA